MTTAYHPITPDILAELRAIVGERHVVSDDREQLERYSHDEVADPHYAAMPEAVVKPGNAAEIAAILKLANRETIPVTPRGAGSGLSCGAVPVHGGIVLSVERMNRVLEIDPQNMMITVEAGIVTNQINTILEPYGLFYAGYPMSLETCFIGGNVAENAGGGKAIKYGVTDRYVFGLEVVLPTGEIVQFGGKMDKLSAQTACQYLNEHFAYQEAGAMLLIELDGSHEAQVEQEYETIGEVCLERGAIEVYVADNHTTQERVWKVRRNIAEAFKVYSPVQSLEDIVVPFAQIPQLMQDIERLSQQYHVMIPSYGHAGDGNLHSTPIKPPDMPMAEWQAILPAILTDLYRATAQLGGTISGEHGIGSKRKQFLPLVLAPDVIALMQRVKTAFDPHNILNPGKIFP